MSWSIVTTVKKWQFVVNILVIRKSKESMSALPVKKDFVSTIGEFILEEIFVDR